MASTGNRITEKYFDQEDFSVHADRVLKEIAGQTGFTVDREIFRGVIFDKNKVGSIIYRGQWKNQPAVLKLQGLKPEVDEAWMIEQFVAQNKSPRIRPPQVYLHQPWSAEHGYGFTISEFVTAPKIFEMPFAGDQEIVSFADFYQEYRTRAITAPWLPDPVQDSAQFVTDRLDHWLKINNAKKRLAPIEYEPYVVRFQKIVLPRLSGVPLVFSHGHVTANDIFVSSPGNYIIMSNLFWSWRPRWYDLAFNVWACLQHIRTPNYTFVDMLRYVDKWRRSYDLLPVTKTDPQFREHWLAIMLERLIGAIVVDLGAREHGDGLENTSFFQLLLKLHQQLFDHLADELEKS